MERYNTAKKYNGLLGLISGNHDCPRIATLLDDNKDKLFFMIHFTLPGVPFLYYGDEIGMKHRTLNSKDGGFQRTGDRTPMQWDNSKNRGFSDTDKELYLPVDDEPCNVEDSLNDPDSLLNFIKDLIKLRKRNEEIIYGDFELIELEKNIISYRRDELKVLINLSGHDYQIKDLNQVLILSDTNSLKGNTISNLSGIIYK